MCRNLVSKGEMRTKNGCWLTSLSHYLLILWIKKKRLKWKEMGACGMWWLMDRTKNVVIMWKEGVEFWEMKVEKWRKGWWVSHMEWDVSVGKFRDVLSRLHACQYWIGKKVFGQRERERTLSRIWPIFVCSKENNVDANTKGQ